MIENLEFTVVQGGVRLDAALLLQCPSSTRAFCRDACAAGEVFVNGRVAPKGMKVAGGETILVRRLLEAVDNRILADRAVTARCIFEDDALLAFDKPAGMPVQPLTCRERGTLMNGVVARWPETADAGDQPLMGGAIHRIDAGTSGLVLVARNRVAFDALRAQFAAQTVEKTYLALVEGSVAVGGTLENELVHDPTLPFCRMIDVSRARAKVRGEPMHAVTKFRPLSHLTCGNEERTLLEVTIFTGVTHQIRAQLAMAGMHVVNDRLYGAFAVEGQEGHCLHSFAAKFLHPVSNVSAKIETSLPVWAVV